MVIVATARLPSCLSLPPQNHSLGTGTIFPQARVETFPASPTSIFNCHGIFHFNYTHTARSTLVQQVFLPLQASSRKHTHTHSQKHTSPASVPSSVTVFPSGPITEYSAKLGSIKEPHTLHAATTGCHPFISFSSNYCSSKTEIPTS